MKDIKYVELYPIELEYIDIFENHGFSVELIESDGVNKMKVYYETDIQLLHAGVLYGAQLVADKIKI